MEPAMFSVANMFGSESGDDDDDAFVERDHTFPGLVLRLREFAFHRVNANLVWPGASIFAEWIVEHEELVKGRHVLELGSGTGALAIFLKKILDLDITTSDYDDPEIENNIRSNCHLNGLATLPHIRHTWGEDFPYANPGWDLIIASDILLYVNQYSNLIESLCFLLKGYNLENEQIARQKTLVIEPYTGDIQTDHQSLSSSRERQCPDARGTSFIPGAMARSLLNSPDMMIETQMLCSDSFTTNMVSLHKPDAAKKAPSWNIKLQGGLPMPCFLMSWRRRIPKEDEALFFDGCRSAGLVVTDFGARIYCIHFPV